MRMTVHYYMKNELCGIGFRGNEYVRAMEFAIREMRNSTTSTLPMKKKDGTEVMVNDCWETYADDYTQESLDWLDVMIRPYALTWCLNAIHSLK